MLDPSRLQILLYASLAAVTLVPFGASLTHQFHKDGLLSTRVAYGSFAGLIIIALLFLFGVIPWALEPSTLYCHTPGTPCDVIRPAIKLIPYPPT